MTSVLVRVTVCAALGAAHVLIGKVQGAGVEQQQGLGSDRDGLGDRRCWQIARIASLIRRDAASTYANTSDGAAIAARGGADQGRACW